MKRFLMDAFTSNLLGFGILLLGSPFFLYGWIHADEERYGWIISGPHPYSNFGGGPYQLWMGASLIFWGTLLLAFALFLRKKLGYY